MSWSAGQYVKFENERNRPIDDLLAHIPLTEVGAAVDIGCGPGNSTELLRARYPKARLTGMDSSPDMIAAARQRLPDIAFEVADIASWRAPSPVDLILANAVLQWLPEHARLFLSLLGQLTPGGVLAVQMPDNLDEPAHRLMRTVAAEGPWAAKLKNAGASRAERHDAAWYYGELRGQAAQVDIWRTVYHHVLPGGADAIVEWFKGSGLRPFLEPLDEEEKVEFLSRYRDAVARAYSIYADSTALLPFPRLFIVATR